MQEWEGAEICYYVDGESYSIDLTDTQFTIITKILGLQMCENRIACFSDETLKRFLKMKNNPLRYEKTEE